MPSMTISCLDLFNLRCWASLSVAKDAVDAGSSKARTVICRPDGELTSTSAVIIRTVCKLLAWGVAT